MPAAVAIPIALAGASMVAQNVQNKAALKNNENQQAAAVGNSQQAWQHAQQMLQQFMQQNPAPFNQTNIARPTPYGLPQVGHAATPTPTQGATGGQTVHLPTGVTNPTPAGQPSSGPPVTLLLQMLQRMHGHAFPQGPM